MQFTIANYMKVALERLANKRRLYFHRKKAHRFRRKLINKRGFEIVDRKLKRSIKEYAKQTFGSSSYWPWLALYTELRGEYKEGWLPKDYIQTFLLKTYNPKDIRICNYKTLDYKMLPDFAIEPLLFNVGTNMYNQERNRITNEEAKKILSNFNNEVVIKEDLGHGGHEITFIHSCKLELEDYSHISSYVIQPLVHQHEQLTALNRTSLNTIRILTFLNKTGGVEVKFAFVRFGIENSKVDNTSSGGGFCFVNSDGSLSNKAYNHIGFELDDNYQNKELFESINIPNYKIIKDKCINAHEMFPYLRIIGWDVAVNEVGEPLLIEWNAAPVLWVLEALRGPFFKEEVLEDNLKVQSRHTLSINERCAIGIYC